MSTTSTGSRLATAGPVHVDFNLTNACNLSCSHCHSASGNALRNELTTAEVIDAVQELHELGVLSIAFAGGEPFMRRDIIDILSAACALPGWRTSVITNGLFFSDAVIAALVEHCPGIGINASIDGGRSVTFGELRAQRGATPAAQAALFRRVTQGVRRAVDAGLAVSVNCTMTRATMSDLVPTYDLATDTLGASGFVAIKFFPAGFGRDHLDRYEFRWGEWSSSFQKLTRVKLAGRLPLMQLSVPSPWEFYLPLVEGGFDLVEAERAWQYRSPLREATYAEARSIGDVAGWAEACVAGDGSVYPSVLMVGDEAVRCGSLRNDGGFAAVWAASENLAQLRGLTVADLAGGCHDCGLVQLCGGGSRSRAMAEYGSLLAPDSSCPLIKAPTSLPLEVVR